MARQDHAADGARSNLYDDIASKIMAELEQGRLPWVQPWGTAAAKASLAMPKNAATSRQYSGINILILWGAVVQHGYPSQHWLTYRQAAALGGNVMKGERGTTVVYADRFTPEDEKRRARETGDEPGRIPFLKRFTVFNAAQCEGLPEDIAVEAPPPPPGMIEPRVEALIRATGIDFRIGGDRAFYVPSQDFTWHCMRKVIPAALRCSVTTKATALSMWPYARQYASASRSSSLFWPMYRSTPRGQMFTSRGQAPTSGKRFPMRIVALPFPLSCE